MSRSLCLRSQCGCIDTFSYGGCLEKQWRFLCVHPPPVSPISMPAAHERNESPSGRVGGHAISESCLVSIRSLGGCSGSPPTMPLTPALSSCLFPLFLVLSAGVRGRCVCLWICSLPGNGCGLDECSPKVCFPKGQFGQCHVWGSLQHTQGHWPQQLDAYGYEGGKLTDACAVAPSVVCWWHGTSFSFLRSQVLTVSRHSRQHPGLGSGPVVQLSSAALSSWLPRRETAQDAACQEILRSLMDLPLQVRGW